MRVLISGIGRSGTTMMYQQIGRMMREAFRAPRYRYEPYLWNHNATYVDEVAWELANLSSFGMYAHQATPLFLPGEHPVHDDFLNRVFGTEAVLPGDPERPDSWLVKIIRGNGRLESYLRRYPDLKVVICLRNPIDTLNSSMGMFSFTGDEFHQTDATRLLAEVGERLAHICLPASDQNTTMAVSAVWWRAFTEWAIGVAAAFPERCHLFAHELMAIDQDAEIDRLAEFLGFSSAETFKSGIDGPAGPKTSSSYLLASDIAELAPQLSYYLNEGIKGSIPLTKRQELRVSLLQRYAERPFSPQRAGDRLGRRTSLQLRDSLHSGSIPASRYAPANLNDPVRLAVHQRTRQVAAKAGVNVGIIKAYAPPRISRKRDFTFGCCITSFNSRETIRDTVYSALDQTMPFDKIVVVDSGSTDGTQLLLQELAERYSRLAVHFGKQNERLPAVRDFAITALGTDFATELDRHDCFWPTKNREEAEVCFDDPSAIAFSPTMHDFNENKCEILNCSQYVGTSHAVYAKLLGRAEGIPRGMTMKVDSYVQAGGYDCDLALHEDWDLKLRLAQATYAWKMSGSRIGTVHNRRGAEQAGATKLENVRALTHAFLKSALRSPAIPELLGLYLHATRPHHNDASKMIASLLALYDLGGLKLDALAPITERVFAAAPDNTYLEQLSALVQRLAPRAAVPVAPGLQP